MKRIAAFSCALFACFSVLAAGDLVLIANPALESERITPQDAVSIYMGRLRAFPSGTPALPLDLPPGAPEKALFYRQLVGKELSAIDAYWARLVLSGSTHPPRQMRSQEDVVDQVARSRAALGYVDRSRVDSRVRVVMEFVR